MASPTTTRVLPPRRVQWGDTEVRSNCWNGGHHADRRAGRPDGRECPVPAGASFGVVVAIFQWGWLSEALKVGGGGPIEAFLPVLFFAILFGLSMDYQVFLVSRMHEEWRRTGDNARAVTFGQGETGGIITAAGLIMIAVFGGVRPR